MMNKKTRKIMQHQRGMTLIEVLVALTIGLVILTAIGTAYVNSTNTARQRENQSELNEPAAIVMRMLQHDVATAGYVDIFDLNVVNQTQAAVLFIPGNANLQNLYQRIPGALPLGTPLSQFFPGLMPVFGCDGAMISTPNAIMATTPPAAVLACGAASATRHSLQIAYQAAPNAIPAVVPIQSLLAPNANTGEGRDCNQQGLAPAGAKFVINRYFVQTSPSDGVNELYCAGSGNSIQQPLARGVEEFVLRYQTAQPGVAPPVGTTSPAAGGAQSQYVNASVVTASPIGWANVTAVEVCMVSATAATGGPAAAGTTVLQTNRPTCERETSGVGIGNFKANVARTAGDRRLWKRFISIISVRNAIYSSPN